MSEILYTYQSEGGALLIDAPTYVKRSADDELYNGLKLGQFCYVLNARQMGKSSLKVRTIAQLRSEGVACAAVDLQGIGTSATEEQWYFGVISRIVRSLGLHRQLKLDDWWRSQPLLSYVQRFVMFLESMLLPAVAGSIVVFIDEVDLTLNLPFRDDFFGALRESYNRRADESEFGRLTFALFGVMTPSDLVQNKQMTPFNVGRSIDLTGLQLSEAQPLLAGLAGKSSQSQVLLEAVLAWSGGQPFLTQKLCRLVQGTEIGPEMGQEQEWVDQLVQTKVIENWEAQDIPPHLRTIRDRLLLSGEARSGRLLGLYQQIVEAGKLEADNSAEQVELRLTGLVVRRDGVLRVYNQVCQAVFNRVWVDKELAKLRPAYYGVALSEWLRSKDESRLLRGEALKDALNWAEGRSLSDDDDRFIKDSQRLENERIKKELKDRSVFIICGENAFSLTELIDLCDKHIVEAENLLFNGSIQIWLIQNGYTDLGQYAIRIRNEYGKLRRKGLEIFIRAMCRLEGRDPYPKIIWETKEIRLGKLLAGEKGSKEVKFRTDNRINGLIWGTVTLEPEMPEIEINNDFNSSENWVFNFNMFSSKPGKYEGNIIFSFEDRQIQSQIPIYYEVKDFEISSEPSQVDCINSSMNAKFESRLIVNCSPFSRELLGFVKTDTPEVKFKITDNPNNNYISNLNFSIKESHSLSIDILVESSSLRKRGKSESEVIIEINSKRQIVPIRLRTLPPKIIIISYVLINSIIMSLAFSVTRITLEIIGLRIHNKINFNFFNPIDEESQKIIACCFLVVVGIVFVYWRIIFYCYKSLTQKLVDFILYILAPYWYRFNQKIK